MKSLIVCLFSYLVGGYKILPYTFDKKNIKYRLCDNAHENLIDTAHVVFEEFNNLDYVNIRLTNDTDKYTIPICNKTTGSHTFGYATFREGETDLSREITISNKLMDNKNTNTLHNVFYHEILHTVGLDHTQEPDNLMSYLVSLRQDLSVIPDKEKQYPGFDDINALDFLYPDKERNVIRRMKKICDILG